MHCCDEFELVPDVTGHTLKEAAQHISGRLRRKNGLTFAQLQQLELDFFSKALVLDVLQTKPLDQFASIEVPHGEMGKQHRFLCGVSLLDKRSDHSGYVKTLLAIETGRQGIRDAFKQIAESHLPIECIAEFHRESSPDRHPQYSDRGDVPRLKICALPSPPH